MVKERFFIVKFVANVHGRTITVGQTGVIRGLDDAERYLDYFSKDSVGHQTCILEEVSKEAGEKLFFMLPFDYMNL